MEYGFRKFGMVSSVLVLFVMISPTSQMVHARRLAAGERSSSTSTDHLPAERNITRKLLQAGEEEGPGGESGGDQSNRIGVSCSKDDISVYQGETGPLPNGIPTYTVQILNACSHGCTMSDIHFSCGWFSSVRLINPTVFRRLGYDDCLVNNGGPLAPGGTLSFQYSNTYQYHLSVSHLSCH